MVDTDMTDACILHVIGFQTGIGHSDLHFCVDSHGPDSMKMATIIFCFFHLLSIKVSLN